MNSSQWLEKHKKRINVQLSKYGPQDETIVVPCSLKNTRIIKKDRYCIYKGVVKSSKDSWNVLLLGHFRRRHISNIRNEETAARIYDCYSMLCNGLKARTNFEYSRVDIENILKIFTEQDVTSPDKDRCIKYLIALNFIKSPK